MHRISLAGFPFGGLVLAGAWWFVLFSPWTAPQQGFWWGMLFATGSLFGYSAWLLRGKWRPLLTPTLRHVWLGIASAIGLYVVFWVGHAVMTAVAPALAASVSVVYARRAEAPGWLLVFLLAFWIAPAEELFWRGVLQRYLQQRLPRLWGLVLATALYALVHIWSGNLPLVAAAAIAGCVWGSLFLWTGSLVPGILSHALWDVLMFVVLPLQ
jgi:hypothetical protein